MKTSENRHFERSSSSAVNIMLSTLDLSLSFDEFKIVSHLANTVKTDTVPEVVLSQTATSLFHLWLKAFQALEGAFPQLKMIRKQPSYSSIALLDPHFFYRFIKELRIVEIAWNLKNKNSPIHFKPILKNDGIVFKLETLIHDSHKIKLINSWLKKICFNSQINLEILNDNSLYFRTRFKAPKAVKPLSFDQSIVIASYSDWSQYILKETKIRHQLVIFINEKNPYKTLDSRNSSFILLDKSATAFKNFYYPKAEFINLQLEWNKTETNKSLSLCDLL